MVSWSTTWGFDVPMTDDLYKAYWGEHGWKEIETQLAIVLIKCADLAAIIDQALPSTKTYDQIPENDRARARAYLDQRTPPTRPVTRKMIKQIFARRSPRHDMEQKVEEIRILEEHITRSTSAWKKVKYVLCSSENLQQHLKALQDDFDALKELVKTAWRLQHPGIDYRTSTLNKRHQAALTKACRFVIQEAKEDRLATKTLYSCCSSTKQALKLELSLFDTTEDSRSKRFHIFVPRGIRYHEYLEVSTVILREDPPSGEVHWLDNFLDACDKVCQREKGLLWSPSDIQNGSVRSQRENKEKFWYSLMKCAMHVGQVDLFRLSDQMTSLVAAERLELAYSIVETGLMLLGISWLSSLSNNTLKRFKANEQPPRYVLDINDRHGLLRTQLWDQRRDLHLHIFIIGITLVEIALRTMVRDFRRSGSRFDLLIGGSEGVKWRSPSHVASLVNEALGAAYSEAVKFCLQDPIHAPNRDWKEVVFYDTTRSEEQKSMELLDLFYENVLIK